MKKGFAIFLFLTLGIIIVSNPPKSQAEHNEDFFVSGVFSNGYPFGDVKTYLRIGDGFIVNGNETTCSLIDDSTNQIIDGQSIYYSNVPDKGDIIQLNFNLGEIPDGWTPSSTYHAECTTENEDTLRSNHFKYIVSPTILEVTQNSNEIDIYFTPPLSTYLPTNTSLNPPYFYLQADGWFDQLGMAGLELEKCEEEVLLESETVSVCHFDLDVNPQLPTTSIARMVLTYSENPTYNREIIYEGASFVPFSVNSIRPELSAIADATITTGSTYEAEGIFTDYDSTNFTATMDYGEGNGAEPFPLNNFGFSISHQYNSPGFYPITLTVYDDDDDGHHGEAFAYITVLSKPLINPLTGGSIIAGGTYAEQGSFSDPDSTAWTATVDYGEGAGSVSLNLDNQNFQLSNTYELPGIYTVILEITDDTNITSTASATVEVDEANAEPVILYPIADTFIKSGSQNENEGGSSIVRLQSSGKNRGLIQFSQEDIEYTIGSSENYTATLQFTITENGNNWGSNGRTIDLHKLTNPWMEGNGYIVGNQPAFRGTGLGATWHCAIDDNIANQTDNCSTSSWNMTNSTFWPFITSPSATTTIVNDQEGIVEMDVTGDIQEFVNGVENFGWLIKKTDEGANGRIEFGSRETESSPKLIITFN